MRFSFKILKLHNRFAQMKKSSKQDVKIHVLTVALKKIVNQIHRYFTCSPRVLEF